MTADTYASMSMLVADLPARGHYEIQRNEARRSKVKLFAPHGGCIEPCTGGLVVELAGEVFDYYVFRGMMKKNCFRTLHVSSTCYDEPSCLHMVKHSLLAVAVHGCSDEAEFLEVGGGNREAAGQLRSHLLQKGFPAIEAVRHRKGADENNFINGARHKGIQLELSVGFRRSLFPSFPGTLQRNLKNLRPFVEAMQGWLQTIERAIA